MNYNRGSAFLWLLCEFEFAGTFTRESAVSDAFRDDALQSDAGMFFILHTHLKLSLSAPVFASKVPALMSPGFAKPVKVPVTLLLLSNFS